MNCVFCDKKLESALPDDLQERKQFQPYAGGGVQFIFCFGSTKFDWNIGTTIFHGYICDDCAEKYIEKMEKR